MSEAQERTSRALAQASTPYQQSKGGTPSNASLSGPDEDGMYTLSVNEPFFPQPSLEAVQAQEHFRRLREES